MLLAANGLRPIGQQPRPCLRRPVHALLRVSQGRPLVVRRHVSGIGLALRHRRGHPLSPLALACLPRLLPPRRLSLRPWPVL